MTAGDGGGTARRYEGLVIEASREDVEWLANAVAAVLATTAVSVQAYQLQQRLWGQLPGPEVLDQLDLEQLVTGTAGIYDPLGQLREWLEAALRAIAEWIVQQIEGIFKPVFDAIRNALGGISDFMQRVRDALISIGEALNRIVVEPLQRMVEWIATELPRIASSLADAVSKAVSTLAELGAMVADALRKGLETVVEWLQSALGTVVNALRSVADFLSRLPSIILSALRGVIEQLSRFVSDMVERIREGIGWIVEQVARLPAALSELISFFAEKVSEAVSGLASAIADAVSRFTRMVTEAAQAVAQGIQQILSGMVERARQLVAQLTQVVTQLPQLVSQAVSTVASALRAAVDAALSALRQGIEWLRNALAGAAQTLVSTVTGLVDTVRSAIAWIADRVAALGQTLARVASSVVATLQRAVSSLVSAIQSALAQAAQAVQGLVSTVAAALRNVADTVRSAVQSAVQALADAVTSAVAAVREGLAGVAQFFEQLRGIVDAIVKGLGQFVELVRDFIRDPVGTLMRIIENAQRWVWEHLPDWARKFFEEAPKVLSGVVDALMGFVNALLKFPEWFPTWFEQHLVRPLLEGAERYIIRPFYETVVKPVQEWIENNIVKPVTEFFGAIAEGFKAIREFLGGLQKAFQEFIEDPLAWIQKYVLQPLYEHVVKPIYEAVVKPALDYLLNNVLKPFWEWLNENVLKPAWDWIHANIVKPVTDFFTAIQNAMKAIADFFGMLVERARAEIEAFFSDPIEWFRTRLLQPLYENVLKPAWDYLYENVLKPFWEWLYQNALKPAWDWLREHVVKPVTDFLSTAYDAVKAVAEFVGNALMQLVDEIRSFASNPLEWVRTRIVEPLYEHALKPAAEWLGKTLEPHLKPLADAASAAVSFFEAAGKTLQEFASDPLGWLQRNLLEPIWNFVSENIVKPAGELLAQLSEKLKPIYEPIYNFFSNVGEALSQVGQVLVNELQAFISDPIGWLNEKGGKLIEFLSKLGQMMMELGVLVGTALARGAGNVFTKLGKVLRDVALTLFVNILSFVADVADAFSRGFARFRPVIEKAVGTIVRAISHPLVPIVGSVILIVLDMVPRLIAGNIENPVQMMYELMNWAVVGIFATLLWSMVAEALSSLLKEVEAGPVVAKVKVSLQGLVRSITDLAKKAFPDVFKYIVIGHMIWWAEPTRAITRYKLSEYLTIELPPIETTVEALRRRFVTPVRDDYYDMFVKQLRMGGIYKGFIDRLWPLPQGLLRDMADRFPWLFTMYSKEVDAITIRDRWGFPRLLPASLVFRLPTPSELARMMIRDIIQDPRHFAAAMSMHGMHPDIALMYYLLHFRYPSPEKLADFFWRGVAGELWNPDKSIDKAMAETFFGGRAPEAVAPRELNFQGEKLFEMIKQYMKWHDYSRLPWASGWPTDNAIVVELMTDVPGKIDLRWMTRWGLFDYWGAYGFGATNTIEEITKLLVVEGQVTSGIPLYEKFLRELRSGKIVFDVRQFARALQATGMHPYWVPWVTIAETINALTEERTLLRTGFINLFREGLWDLDTLNKLMAGFFMVTFRTAFYDFAEHRWKEAEVEVPVAFLPAESKLLQLRAVMDKALDIYREAYRYLIRSTLYYVATVEEAKQILERVVRAINESFFVDEMRAITGKELPIALDTGYWRAWETYVTLLQDIEARERTRFYARYLLWSVLWGLRWGYTTYEEARQWVDRLVETMHEHRIVRDAIRLSVDFMLQRFYKEISVRATINLLRSRRITVEEAVKRLMKLGFSEEDARLYIDAQVLWYTPSITTYASMLEVVPEALDTIIGIVYRFNLPSDEQRYWMLYLARQPVRDELTLVRTRIFNALALGMTWEELARLLSGYAVYVTFEDSKVVYELGPLAAKAIAFYEANRKLFEAFGVSPHEWVLYNLIAVLEQRIDELRRQARERIPSPSTLAVLAEYIVLPEELVEKTLRRYGVAEEWIPYWLQYIRVKPLKSDYKQLFTAYMRALRYGAVTREEVEKLIDKLAEKGFTPEELDILRKRVELEEAILEARELRRQYLPTPYMLATLSEYITIPENLVRRVLLARRVPEEWVELWLRFIRVRPLADEARLLATAYFRAKRYGVPLGELEEKILRILKELGFTEEELRIRELRAAIEAMIDQWREAQREYIPTPYMIATMAEYVPAVRAFLARVLEARRVPAEWWSVWQVFALVRPLANELRRVVNAVLRLYEYFAIDAETLEKVLSAYAKLGLEAEEVRLLVYAVELERQLRAYRELVGDPDRLARLAEYSPRARRLALAQLQKMIDALPVDQQTKEFLKKMWEEFIRVRPVYDEVRRYVTELISDYANGVISYDELRRELEDLKEWGLDDYEIQFYLWLAEKRRLRYLAREARRYGATGFF